MFKHKRYAFSERLRQRERRRRRLRLSALCALGVVLLGAALQSNSDIGVQVEGSPELLLAETPSDVSQARASLTPSPKSQSKKFIKEKKTAPTNGSRTQKVASKGRLHSAVAKLEIEQALLGVSSPPKMLALASGVEAELSIDLDLQRDAEELMEKYQLPYGAIVAMEPASGRIITLAGSSAAEKESDNFHFALRAGMPAASLIKVVSAAAAIEQGGSKPSDKIYYRGGRYTLNKWNYKPDSSRDTRFMSLEKALATSCNPVFGRLGLQVTGSDLLSTYAQFFGFNERVPFVLPLQPSHFAEIIDDYSLARTAAGFGEVTISPLHAAMLMGAVANEGEMMKPLIVQRYISHDGLQRVRTKPESFLQVVTPDTARVLMEMLETTTTSGTGRRQFSAHRAPKLRGIRVAAKTGTLSGPNPKGRYHWLIAAAPAENPTVAIAALVVDTGNARINGAGLGRLFLEKYFAKYKEKFGQKV